MLPDASQNFPEGFFPLKSILGALKSRRTLLGTIAFLIAWNAVSNSDYRCSFDLRFVVVPPSVVSLIQLSLTVSGIRVYRELRASATGNSYLIAAKKPRKIFAIISSATRRSSFQATLVDTK
jgi:hypothetical protein